MSNPLVSIVMNCFNGQRFLERSLKSIISQKYENFELIFWDNLSKDESEKIFRQFKDQRFKYFKPTTHKTLYEARNDALKKCNGEYVSFLDTDDYWLENRLSLQVPLMEQNKKVGLIYGNYIKYNENKIIFKKKKLKTKDFKSGMIFNHLIKNYNIGLLTVLIRKRFMKDDLQYFDTKYNLLSDFDYILRFSKKHSLDFVKNCIAVYHQHENQLQSKFVSNQAQQFESWFEKKVKGDKIFDENFNENYDFQNIKKKIRFLKFVSKLKKNKSLYEFMELLKYPNNIDKIKLFLIFFLPNEINKRLFSLT